MKSYSISLFCSCLDELLFVINFCVQFVEVSNEGVAFEGHAGLDIVPMLLLKRRIKLIPLLVKLLPVFFILFHCIDFLLCRVHLERVVKGKWVNLFENCFEGDEGFLQDLMPMVLSQVHNNWDKHWEGFLFVGF